MFLLFVCVALMGHKSMKKQHLRIQEGHFLKSALNLDLTLSDYGKCPALLESSGIIDLGAFCVELWPKQVSYRISAPMTYISCSRLIISMFHKNQKCKLFFRGQLPFSSGRVPSKLPQDLPTQSTIHTRPSQDQPRCYHRTF